MEQEALLDAAKQHIDELHKSNPIRAAEFHTTKQRNNLLEKDVKLLENKLKLQEKDLKLKEKDRKLEEHESKSVSHKLMLSYTYKGWRIKQYESPSFCQLIYSLFIIFLICFTSFPSSFSCFSNQSFQL